MRSAKSHRQWQARQLCHPCWGPPVWQSCWVNKWRKPASQKPLTAEVSAKQSIKCQLHTTHVGAVSWEPNDMCGEGGSRVTSKLRQGAHIHQPTAWPLPHPCAQPYHTGSGSHGRLFRPDWGSSAWHSRQSVNWKNPCIKDPFLLRQVL